MSRPGPFTIMARYWKRSLVFFPISTGLLWYSYDYTVTRSAMKTCCSHAVLLGDEKIHFNGQPKHITVILNPAACARKAKKLYTKWAEPLLHLAGFKVSLIETKSPGEAFNLMKIMSNCDAVAVVGGDGTIHEVLNGLMNRPDCASASRNFPLAIIPAGQYNSIARLIHQELTYRNQKEFIMGSTMSLINSIVEKYDVLKVSPLVPCSDEGCDDKAKPIYALRDVRYGKYQDNYYKVSGYQFYQEYVKPMWLRFRRMFSDFVEPQIKCISYTAPCEGCSRCWDRHRLKNAELPVSSEASANRRWWRALIPVSSPPMSAEERIDLQLSKKDNPDCDKWIQVENTDSITDFRAGLMNRKLVRLSLGRNGEYTPSQVVETQDVRLELKPEVAEANQTIVSKANSEVENSELPSDNERGESKNVKKKDDDGMIRFLIDREPVEANSIEVTSISKAVNIFTGRMTSLRPAQNVTVNKV